MKFIALILLVIALIAVAIASWQVGGLLLLSAVILGLAFGLRRARREQSEPEPTNPNPNVGSREPRTRDPHGN